MRISQNWLQQYIKFKLSPEVLADKLTMLGLEVEGFERPADKYERFVVGKVLEVSRHPNADKLSVCKVDTGKEALQIVCGAPNVAAGQKVAVGLSGAVVPKNQHDPNGKPFTLSQVKLRGVDSFGMICSAYELDLGEDKDGILILEPGARVGQPLAAYLGLNDVVYEIGITPNRPDLLSHFGVAREVGVLVNKKPQLPRVRLKEGKTPIKKYLSVNVIDRENCPRFAVRMIKGVRLGPSPAWLQQALRAVGLRSRNAVVDITNYVMLECGQPLHAFDYAKLKGQQINVRQAEKGSQFTTLDSKTHTLPDGAVMVCDGEREVSIAGVMGGENSEISDTTVDIVLESAYWNPSSIRRTSKELGIQSDASYRFERGADPNACIYALDRAAALILELAGGELLKGTLDVYPKRIISRGVPLRAGRVNRVLGTNLSSFQITELLRKLDITKVSTRKDAMVFRVPSYRVDLVREIDLIEEVARVFGYGNIPDKTLSTVDFAQSVQTTQVADAVRNKLVGSGYNEAYSISIQDQETAKLGGANPVELLNPLGKEMSTMRTSLIPGLLKAAAINRNHGTTDLRLFEIGHVFRKTDSAQLVDNIQEAEKVCILLSGNAAPRHWQDGARKIGLFDLKGEVSDLLDACGLDSWRFIYYSTSETLAENPISIKMNGREVGYLGIVKEEICRLFGFEEEAFIAEVELDALVSTRQKRYRQLVRFPKVQRDVAFVLDAKVGGGDVLDAIELSGGNLLQRVELFDLYEGQNLPPGKKSLAFSLEFQSEEKTLTDSEIDNHVRSIVTTIEKQFGAELRSS